VKIYGGSAEIAAEKKMPTASLGIDELQPAFIDLT
jgi:hypothetical protein